MATTARNNKELVRRTFDALNEQDRDAFAETQADDLVLHDASEEVHGIEAVTDYEWTFFEAFPDLAFTIEDLIEEDDRVAFRFTATGTHDGALEEIDPTGRSIEISEIGMARVEDGEVAEVWIQGDELGLMQQLGVLEDPAE